MSTLNRALELVVVLSVGAVALHVNCVPGTEVLGSMVASVACVLGSVFAGL